MKKIMVFGVVWLFIAGCAMTRFAYQSKYIIEEVRQQYAPDLRTAVFRIHAEKKGQQVTLTGETDIAGARRVLEDRFRRAGYEVTDAIRLLPDTALHGKTYGVVRLSVANLRSKPSVSAGLETQALMGMPLRVLKREGHWYLVKTPERYTRWMNGGAFVLMTRDQFDSWAHSKKVIFTGGLGYAYSGPDVHSTPVTDLLTGGIMQFVNRDGDFTKVRLPDGTPAFVPSESIRPYDQWLRSRELTAENIERAAYSYLGVPYLWGGTSGKGLDCSGFTKNVFLQNGIMLPRDASQQIAVGIEVPIDDKLSKLRKGDLLFFGRRATGDKKERITHVGIYLGNGQFIHAGSDRAQVAVESLFPDDPAFAERRRQSLLHARRIIGAGPDKGVRTVAETMYDE